MAMAIVCDRCGRNSEQTHSLEKFVEIRGMKYSSLDTYSECLLCKDLCSQCLEDLVNFIKEGPKNNIMEDDLK